MDYKLSLKQGFNATISEDLDEVDVVRMLQFDETDIEHLLRTHAATQVYWEALAIRYKYRYESFKGEGHRKWWAYHRSYAKYVLASYGDLKPTVEAIKDTVVLIYSETTTAQERLKYAALAYSVASLKKTFFDGSEQEFFDLMFKYTLADPFWYFETVVRTLNKLNEDSALVESVAEKLNSRGFHMRDLLQLVSAKQHNMGAASISDGDTAERINNRR